MIEMWLGESYVTFDGKVLEIFSSRDTSKSRLHVATLRGISIGQAGGKLYVQPDTVWGGAPFLIYFPEAQRMWADRLVQLVMQARPGQRRR